MLYLKALNGKFFVMHKSFPQGHLAAYTREHIAREYMQWLIDREIDIGGLLSRLHFNKLTPQDTKLIRLLNHAARHETRVIYQGESVQSRLARLRRTAKT